MSNDRFELEYNLFSALGGLFNGKKTALSPLSGGDFKPMTPDISEKLRASQILDETGQPLAGFSPALEALGQPEAYARLRFIGAAKFIDYAVYFSQNCKTSLSATPSGLVISPSDEGKEILKDLKQYLGETIVQNSSFETRVSIDEAVVLAALIDLRRSAFMRALSDYAPVTPAPFDIYQITRIIASGLDQAQWLSGMLRTLCAIQNPMPSSQVQVALSNLASKGLLQQSERGFGLNEATGFLADRLLVINNVIWLEAAHANMQDKVAFGNMVCCQAGLNDLLCMRFDGKEVILHASAPAKLLEKIRQHLIDPEILPAPALVQTTLKLSVMSGPAAGQSYALKALITLGRESDSDIQVKDIKVSRKHAQIAKVGEVYQITDLGSTNGTYVNGIAIKMPVTLKESDIITLGETRLTLVSVAESGAPVVSEATMYAEGDVLPLAGVEIPSAQPAKMRNNGKTGPFVDDVEELPPPEAVAVAPQPDIVAPQPIIVLPAPVDAPPPEAPKSVCPNCGNAVAPGARFCGSCGQGM